MNSRYFSIFKESRNSFEGQQEGARVILTLRRHIFVILLPLSLILVAACMPIFVWVEFSGLLNARGLEAPFWFVTSLWYLICWLGAFYLLTMYLLNTVIITGERLIDNEQEGFFNRKISELHTHRVQDVSVHTLGIIKTLLHFGDIEVQTAAAEKQFIFRNIPDPEKVKDVIMHTVSSEQMRVNSGIK